MPAVVLGEPEPSAAAPPSSPPACGFSGRYCVSDRRARRCEGSAEVLRSSSRALKARVEAAPSRRSTDALLYACRPASYIARPKILLPVRTTCVITLGRFDCQAAAGGRRVSPARKRRLGWLAVSEKSAWGGRTIVGKETTAIKWSGEDWTREEVDCGLSELKGVEGCRGGSVSSAAREGRLLALRRPLHSQAARHEPSSTPPGCSVRPRHRSVHLLASLSSVHWP